MKKYIAEAFGTFGLTFVVLLSSLNIFPVPAPVMAVLTVGLFVYALGYISGSHINPAVTFGLWSIKKISTTETVYYIISQIFGALVALFLYKFIYSTFDVVPQISVSSGNSLNIIIAEFVGMFFYAFFIASFVYEKVPKQLFGIFIAGALLLGSGIAAYMGSLGIINPAVALGMGSYNFAYLFAPLLGSALGMNFYKYFDK